MSSNSDIKELLCLISQPAFYVCGNQILESNDSAKRLLIETGTSITNLLPQENSQYKQFQEGCLFLTLHHNGTLSGATVTRFSDGEIFVLDTDDQKTALKTLALTAANMRQPLSSMIATAGSLSPLLEKTDDPKTREHLEQINQNLCQMHRMLCNMSDVLQYADGTSNHMVCQNIVSVVETVLQKAQALAEYCGVQLDYSVPNETVLCSIDDQLLERGIFNMISNALKFSEKGGHIHVSLVRRGKTMYISVKDSGAGIPPQLMSGIFQRYQRQPGLEDSRFGLGLGLTLVRSAAMVHGGTVLIDQPEGSGSRVTMSIPIRQSSNSVLRSDIITVDYAGGWDHGLLELSDVLPSHLYQSKN